MIVVDSNVIAALVLPTTENSELAIRALEADRDWVAPVLWRSEFCNILATGIRNSWWSLDEAKDALAAAEEAMYGGDYSVPTARVLELAAESGCTGGYDSEFVALAMDLSVELITLDRAVLRAFPNTAISLSEFVGRQSAQRGPRAALDPYP
jgi:predicted nucleic acid-binding protein